MAETAKVLSPFLATREEPELSASRAAWYHHVAEGKVFAHRWGNANGELIYEIFTGSPEPGEELEASVMGMHEAVTFAEGLHYLGKVSMEQALEFAQVLEQRVEEHSNG